MAYKHPIISLHSIHFFRQCLNHQVLVLIPPPSHPSVSVNKRPDIIRDILLLPSFVVKRYRVWGQWFKNGLNVKLWATGNTYMDIREVKANQFLDELEYLFSWRWNT